MLTVGGRAYWVNCSYYTSNSFILHFGDLGLTLHNASIYFTLTRDYILRGPQLVFLVNLWWYTRRPSYSLEVQPPVYQKYCCMKPDTVGSRASRRCPQSPTRPPTPRYGPEFSEGIDEFILLPRANFDFSINSAQGDFGLGGSRIWVNIDILRSSTRPHVAWSLGLNPTRFLRELSFPLFTNPEFNRLQVLELVFRCSALRLFIQISPLTILRFSKIPASPRP
ncbi:hypothetical protein DFH09DRAFT_1285793 [Mycena vulgaris]|nr:hypothetical protein DFH09DRAFT_1285793 [Mycena vulgaris]